jgi:hypothetical protein
MIAFFWSFIAAIGFTFSGVLLREGEFRISAILFVSAWAWLVFPKLPMWLIRQTGRLLHGQRKAAA